MICLKNKEEVKNCLDNKKSIVTISEDATQAEIVRGLDFVHASLSDEKTSEQKYQLADKSRTIAKRVTERVPNTFNKGKSDAEIQQEELKYAIYNESGTFLHNTLEQIGTSMYNGTYKTDRPNILKAATTSKEFGLTAEQFRVLEDGFTEIYNEIKNLQETIDPNGKAVLRFEHRVLDPYSDEAGTIDLMVIFSDGSGYLYDFKSVADKGNPGLFSKGKQQAHEIQLSTYKKILIQHQGVKRIRGGRVVPIVRSFKSKKDPTTKQWVQTRDFDAVQMGKSMGKKLQQRMILPETTGVKSLDKLIQQMHERLNKVPNDELSEFLNSLVVSQDLKPMVDYMTHVATTTLDHYNKHGNLDGKYDLIKEVEIAAGFLDMLTGELNKLERYPELKEAALDYSQRITELRSAYTELSEIRTQVLVDHAYRAANKKAPEDPTALILKEDSLLTKWMGRVTDFNNPFFKYLRKVLDDIQFEVRSALRKDVADINTVHDNVQKWMKENNKTWNDVVDLIFNRETENFYAEYSQSFYEERASAVKRGDYKWILQRYQPKADYQKKFNEKLAEKQKEVEGKYPDKKVQFEIMDQWRSTRDLSLDSFGNPEHPRAWTNWSNLELKESFKDDARSEEFKRIRSIEPVYQYYKTFIEMNQRFRKMLNLDYRELPDNFVPFIRKDIIEKMQTVGIGGAWDELKQTFAIREDETAFGHINDLTGKYDKTVPIYFTNPFKDATGNIQKGEKSTDFTRSLILFSKMANNYRYMSKYEANMLAMRDVLETARYAKKDTKGRLIFNSFGDLKAKVDVDPIKIFDSFVDYYFYGKTLQEEGKTIKVFGQEVNTVQLARKAKQYFSLKSLGLAFLPATASYVSAGTQAWMEGKEGIVYNSEQWKNATFRIGTDFTRYHSLFKFFEVSNDDLLSTVSVNKKGSLVGDNLYQDKIRKYLSSRALMAPYRLGDEHLDANIANAMAENYVVNQDGVLRRKSMVTGEEWKSILDVFSVTEDGVVSISHVKPEKVKDVVIKFKKAVREAQRGIKGTMTDEDIMYAQTRLFTNLLMQFRTWMPGVLNKRFGSLHYNENLDALKMGKYKALASDVNIAEAASFVDYLRKGFLPTVAQVAKDLTLGTITLGKIESLKYNVEGRYQSNEEYKKAVDAWFTKWKQQNADEFTKLIEVYGSEEAVLADFVNIKQRAIRNTMNELRAVMLLFSLILFLKSDFDDDGEELWKEYWLAHKAMQIANRTMTELKFAFDPTSFQTLLRSSTLPIAGLLVDFTNVVKEIFVEPVSDAITGREEKKGENEPLDRIAKLFPAITQMVNLFDISDKSESLTQ